jgi:hydroxyacylglutathione hydrolase
VAEGDEVAIGAQTARVIEVYGHTRGHIAYWFSQSHALFCGDTLFSLGCGRLFEGKAEEMWASLLKLRAMPDDTRVYCAHEYTAGNAAFALTIDAANPALIKRAAEVRDLRARGLPTVPSTIGAERAANPFLRADDARIKQAIGLPAASSVEAFAEIRRRKDVF